MKTLRSLLFTTLLLAFSAPLFGQVVCYTKPTNYPNTPFTYANNFWPGWRNNLELDFNDYGLIFEDAKKRDCSLWAKEALKTKVQETNTWAIGRTHTHAGYTGLGPYQNWLEGALVGLASAAALAIGGHGDMTSELDGHIQTMITNFNTRPASTPSYYRYGLNTNCGVGTKWRDDTNNSSDTCMDDHSVGALGHAWAAAYQHKRGNTTSRDSNILKAKNAINDAFRLTETNGHDSICLHDPDPAVGMSASGRGPCNVTSDAQISTVLTRTNPAPGYTFAMNRGENQVYGFGLVASISAASVGLEEAGTTWSLSDNQKLLVQALLEEAQRKAKPGLNDGEYFNGHFAGPNNCARWTSVGATVSNPNDGACADSHHRPRMYSLVGAADPFVAPNTFFSRYLPGVSAKTNVYDPVTGSWVYNAFQFNRFLWTDFKKDVVADPSEKPGWARAVAYGNLAYYWHTIQANRDQDNQQPVAGEKRPRLSATFDDNDPIGYIDGIDTNGVAWGWTCDKDVPTKQTYVDLYQDNVPGLGTFLLRVKANQTSESAINSLCNGGLAHRWSAQLPYSAKGHYIYPYGLDATWRGYTLLPPSSGCSGGVCIYP